MRKHDFKYEIGQHNTEHTPGLDKQSLLTKQFDIVHVHTVLNVTEVDEFHWLNVTG